LVAFGDLVNSKLFSKKHVQASTDHSKYKRSWLNPTISEWIYQFLDYCVRRVERKTRRVEKKASFENSAERVKNVFGITLQSFGGIPV
jgi:hypothetical protein